MKIFTIGFAGKPAESFFGLLGDNQIGRLVDVRLNPRGQLAVLGLTVGRAVSNQSRR